MTAPKKPPIIEVQFVGGRMDGTCRNLDRFVKFIQFPEVNVNPRIKHAFIYHTYRLRDVPMLTIQKGRRQPKYLFMADLIPERYDRHGKRKIRFPKER